MEGREERKKEEKGKEGRKGNSLFTPCSLPDSCQGILGPGYGERVLPRGSVVKNLPANVGDMSLTPQPGGSPAEGNGNPLQYSCPENPMDRGAWQATVHGAPKNWTCLIN